MKNILSFLLCLVGLSVLAQGPVLRNAVTTNGTDTSTASPLAVGAKYQGAGANQFVWTFGGSGSALAELPPHGNEIWANQPFGMFIFDLRGDLHNSGSNGSVASTEYNWTNLIVMLRTNSVISGLTNQRVRVGISLANGWPTNHRASNGELRWNTNRYPSATINPSNFVNLSHAQGVEIHLFNYFTTQTRSNGVTEIGTILNGALPFWYYPAFANPYGAQETFPAWDLTSTLLDMSSYYTWKVDGAWFQDIEPYYFTTGYQNQMRRMISDAAVNPYGLKFNNTTQQRNWQAWNGYFDETRFNEHGMVLKFMVSLVGGYWPMSAEYEANGLTMGSNAHTNEITGSGGIGEVIGIIRPQLYWLTNQLGKTHPAFQPDSYTQSAWNTNEWKHLLGQMAMWNGDVFILGVPPPNILTNPVFQGIVTNSNFIKVWHDPIQDVPYAGFRGSNGYAVKQLSQENAVAVLAFNEGAVATNITVPLPWINAPIASNTICAVIDVWTGTVLNTASNNVVLTVAPTNSAFVIVTRQSTVGGVTASGPLLFPNQVPLGVSATHTISNANASLSFNAPSLVNAFTITSAGRVGVADFTYGAAALTLSPIGADQYSLAFRDEYNIGRNTSSGFLTFTGTVAGANGFIFTGADGRGLVITNTGIYAPTNFAPFRIVTNDFVLNQLYTNGTQRAFVTCNFDTWFSAGYGQAGLFIDQDNNNNFEDRGIKTSTVFNIVSTNQQALFSFLQPGARFVFTNMSGGAVTISPYSSRWTFE